MHIKLNYDSSFKDFSLWLKTINKNSLREKCPYSELFWSAFSRIRTEYSYSVRMRENSDQNNSNYRHFLHTDNWEQLTSDLLIIRWLVTDGYIVRRHVLVSKFRLFFRRMRQGKNVLTLEGLTSLNISTIRFYDFYLSKYIHWKACNGF